MEGLCRNDIDLCRNDIDLCRNDMGEPRGSSPAPRGRPGGRNTYIRSASRGGPRFCRKVGDKKGCTGDKQLPAEDDGEKKPADQVMFEDEGEKKPADQVFIADDDVVPGTEGILSGDEALLSADAGVISAAAGVVCALSRVAPRRRGLLRCPGPRLQRRPARCCGLPGDLQYRRERGARRRRRLRVPRGSPSVPTTLSPVPRGSSSDLRSSKKITRVRLRRRRCRHRSVRCRQP